MEEDGEEGRKVCIMRAFRRCECVFIVVVSRKVFF